MQVEQLTYTVNICCSRIGKIIVNDTIDTFEIHSTSNNISGNQNPSFPQSEIINSILPLEPDKKLKSEIYPSALKKQNPNINIGWLLYCYRENIQDLG